MTAGEVKTITYCQKNYRSPVGVHLHWDRNPHDPTVRGIQLHPKEMVLHLYVLHRQMMHPFYEDVFHDVCLQNMVLLDQDLFVQNKNKSMNVILIC